MNNDNNISQTVAISEATQKPTRQRFIVLAILLSASPLSIWIG